MRSITDQEIDFVRRQLLRQGGLAGGFGTMNKKTSCICDAMAGRENPLETAWCGGHKALLRALSRLPALSTSTLETDTGQVVLCIVFQMTGDLLMSVTWDEDDKVLILMDPMGIVVDRCGSMVELLRSMQTNGHAYLESLKGAAME